MKAVIGIENRELVVRLYIGGVFAGVAVRYRIGAITKDALEGELRAMGHEVVEPWEIARDYEDALCSSKIQGGSDAVGNV